MINGINNINNNNLYNKDPKYNSFNDNKKENPHSDNIKANLFQSILEREINKKEKLEDVKKNETTIFIDPDPLSTAIIKNKINKFKR